jgi:sugar/nucleoside kinase (ribokinase family)
MEEGLSCVTYLKFDRAEAELLTGLADLDAAARKLASYGPEEVLVTQSSGVTVYAEGRIHRALYTSRTPRGRTGRGDTCFGTYLGQRLRSSPQDAVRFAAAVTSLRLEKPGPRRGSFREVQALVDHMS